MCFHNNLKGLGKHESPNSYKIFTHSSRGGTDWENMFGRCIQSTFSPGSGLAGICVWESAIIWTHTTRTSRWGAKDLTIDLWQHSNRCGLSHGPPDRKLCSDRAESSRENDPPIWCSIIDLPQIIRCKAWLFDQLQRHTPKKRYQTYCCIINKSYKPLWTFVPFVIINNDLPPSTQRTQRTQSKII